MLERLLLLLQVYDGPMFVRGDFNCTLEPRQNRSYIAFPGRHDSLPLRRHLGRAQLSDVPDGDMEIDEEERELYRHFRRRLTLISTRCRAVIRQI